MRDALRVSGKSGPTPPRFARHGPGERLAIVWPMVERASVLLVSLIMLDACTVEVINPVPLASVTGDEGGGGSGAGAGSGGGGSAQGGGAATGGVGGGGGPTSGGACTLDGVCALADPGGVAASVTAIGDRVFWTEPATNPSLSNGAVRSRDVRAALPASVLRVGGQHDPAGISAIESRVYWSSLGLNDGLGGDGTISWCPLDGACEPTVSAAATTAYDLVVGDRLYWVELGNGTGAIWACDPDACQPEKILDVPSGMPFGLALANGTLVWGESHGPQLPTIQACVAASCVPRVLYRGADLGAVTTDGSQAYFRAGDAIGVCPLTDDCTPMLGKLTTGWSAISGLAVDDDHVYFTNAPMGGGGGVYRCSKSLGCHMGADVIAAGDDVAFSPGKVVLTDTYVVWADINRGVFSAPK